MIWPAQKMQPEPDPKAGLSFKASWHNAAICK